MTLTTQKFDKIEKAFLSHLNRIFTDLNESITILRKTKNSLIKSELCLAFIAADTFSRFYKIIQGASEEELDSKIEERFKHWFKDFVFTEKNETYAEHKEEINCDTGIAWKLRNALIHFYGLPDPQKTGGSIALSGGDSKLMRECEKKFKAISNQSVRLIHPYFLIEAIKSGLLVQLLSMAEMIKQRPNDYVKSVLLAHKIIMREGTVYVSNNDPINQKWYAIFQK